MIVQLLEIEDAIMKRRAGVKRRNRLGSYHAVRSPRDEDNSTPGQEGVTFLTLMILNVYEAVSLMSLYLGIIGEY